MRAPPGFFRVAVACLLGAVVENRRAAYARWLFRPAGGSAAALARRPVGGGCPPAEKTVFVVATGRSGSSTLLALLNRCVAGAFVQGENDLALWWLYKYELSAASYGTYSGRSSDPALRAFAATPSSPFYRRITADAVAPELDALVDATVRNGACARVAGLKEVRWLERAGADAPPGDA